MKNIYDFITVPAERTRLATDKKVEQVEVTFALQEEDSGFFILKILHGGVTGYESYYLDPKTIERNIGKPWLACMGTEGRWDRLMIPEDSMKRVYEFYGIGDK